MADRIWAPWRMEFIRQGDAPAGCVLCGYVGRAPERESGVLACGPHAYVVLNKYPYAAGHLMVVPNRHVASLASLDEAEHDALWRLVRASAERLQAATGADGLNVGVNLGRAAGAGIHEHLHVHLVPRWVGDSNFMPVIADARVMPEYLGATWDRLAPELAGLGAA